MKCRLMNKHTQVALVEYNEDIQAITNIYEVKNIEYAPLSFYNTYYNMSISDVKAMNQWFQGRGIPSSRKNLKHLLERLNISNPSDLLNKHFALSLSDQYWIVEEHSRIQWEDINFFTHDFDSTGFLQASLDDSVYSYAVQKDSLKTPNNTTDGMLQKGWIIENDKRVLIKGTYTRFEQEPFNEWLSSQICKRLGFDHCNYIVEWYTIKQDKVIVSKCENFINQNEEIISAYDAFQSSKKENTINDYEHYVRILENHGILDARKKITEMFVVDYLTLNVDRHLKNFGIIRNVETLKWERVTPIFDTGQSMCCDEYTQNMDFTHGCGKFFTDANKDYNAILKSLDMDTIRAIPIQSLKRLSEEYYVFLKSFQSEMEYKNKEWSDERLKNLKDGLSTRIDLFAKEREQI
ncbi:HipA domain-containing protein [Holdemanella porci]|uniref:HipA domain-containing protein n=1 Tax=Holdemanella porci TaxID=2652276 RepID=UPI001C280882|nr:HipA domain-containing protein [Holdemanella porci]MBU9129423.1 HipA domain-containing protein [Holdemanella porci]